MRDFLTWKIRQIGGVHPTFYPIVELVTRIIIRARVRCRLQFVSLKPLHPVLINESIGAALCKIYQFHRNGLLPRKKESTSAARLPGSRKVLQTDRQDGLVEE